MHPKSRWELRHSSGRSTCCPADRRHVGSDAAKGLGDLAETRGDYVLLNADGQRLAAEEGGDEAVHVGQKQLRRSRRASPRNHRVGSRRSREATRIVDAALRLTRFHVLRMNSLKDLAAVRDEQEDGEEGKARRGLLEDAAVDAGANPQNNTKM